MAVPAIHTWIAEAIGTFMLVLAGTGAIVINEAFPGVLGHGGIAFCFGMIVLTVIYTIGDTSGAHINPAVTIAFWLAKRFPGKQVLPYIVFQCLGAIAASLVVLALFPAGKTLGGTVPSGAISQSFILEIILTWWLMVVILGVSEGSKEKGIVAGMVIGGVVALAAMYGGPISGASMNPARSLGPGLVGMKLDTLWIYLSAPIIGAALAVPTCRILHGNNCCTPALPDKEPADEKIKK